MNIFFTNALFDLQVPDDLAKDHCLPGKWFHGDSTSITRNAEIYSENVPFSIAFLIVRSRFELQNHESN